VKILALDADDGFGLGEKGEGAKKKRAMARMGRNI
jgi:hypothetical protein